MASSDCDCGGSQNPGLVDLVVEECDNETDDKGDGLTDCEDNICRSIAPPLDPTNLIDFSDSIKFLYEGDNAIIRGLDPSVLELENIAVVRSKIVAEGVGKPLLKKTTRWFSKALQVVGQFTKLKPREVAFYLRKRHGSLA